MTELERKAERARALLRERKVRPPRPVSETQGEAEPVGDDTKGKASARVEVDGSTERTSTGDAGSISEAGEPASTQPTVVERASSDTGPTATVDDARQVHDVHTATADGPPTEPSRPDDASATTADGLPTPTVVTEPTFDPDEIKRRIDGSLKGAAVSDEFKRALIDCYEEHNGVNVRELAAATGFGVGALWRALQEYPATLERVRQNRRAATVDDLSQALAAMARRLREAIDSGALDVNSKNVRDFAIAFGIFSDKQALLDGEATARVEFGRAGDFEDRKRRMLDVLDRAESTLKLVKGGA